jgi:hypothetical protein
MAESTHEKSGDQGNGLPDDPNAALVELTQRQVNVQARIAKENQQVGDLGRQIADLQLVTKELNQLQISYKSSLKNLDPPEEIPEPENLGVGTNKDDLNSLIKDYKEGVHASLVIVKHKGAAVAGALERQRNAVCDLAEKQAVYDAAKATANKTIADITAVIQPLSTQINSGAGLGTKPVTQYALSEMLKIEIAEVTETLPDPSDHGKAVQKQLYETWHALNAAKTANTAATTDIQKKQADLETAKTDLTGQRAALQKKVLDKAGTLDQPTPKKKGS